MTDSTNTMRTGSIPAVKVPPHPEWPTLSPEQLAASKERIKNLLREQNAVLVAHYYTDANLQELAEESGGCVADSLEMARFGAAQTAETLVVCGVRFMGETAKILNPEKRVLMPDLNATCSLDEGCPADQFTRFCDQHPDHTVVVYANTSADGLLRTADGGLYVAGHFQFTTDFGLAELTPISLYEDAYDHDGYLVRIDELPTGGGAETTWVKQLKGYGDLTVANIGLSYDPLLTPGPILSILGSFDKHADFDPIISETENRNGVHGNNSWLIAHSS